MLCAVEAVDSMLMPAIAAHRPKERERIVIARLLNSILVDTQTNAAIQSHNTRVEVSA